jgi:predicted transposase YbfD/YdcC
MTKTKKKMTLSFDGKTIRSTEKMSRRKDAMHIISAQVAELGMTIGQLSTGGKGCEIAAMVELLETLEIENCVVVADALHCQKETAEKIIEKKCDYLLSVKDNQPTLKREIADFVGEPTLRGEMDTMKKYEKNRGRQEIRAAYVTNEIGWLYGRENWKNIACIGAINTKFTTKKGESNEWHYYISSAPLTAEDLLRHARAEWSVETMHWLLDVHFGEDFCRIEDDNIQQNLNIARKIALNSINLFKSNTNSKFPISKIMFNCLLDPALLLDLL